ncbi:phage tail tape measure protein [Liquorilactobacillus uvarum]|uniref:phage tail tape measure protein n=1 Tax=Liquorilactobacillus uvarum TaxID=303240 RepID=UPI00288AB0B5|nr:phage tail tape measure protein [Liquorilactobacillus uvarum]
MAERKISATMATKIALDLVEASKSIKSMTNLVKSSTNATKAMSAAYKESGDYLNAAKARFEGYTETISRQESKISALKERQKELGISTDGAAKHFLELKDRISELQQKQNGLDTSIDKNKTAYKELGTEIASLKREQNELDSGTVKTANQYLNYQRQIDSAAAQLSKFKVQQEKAKEQMDLQASGVLKLKNATELQEKVTKSYSDALEAQGKHVQAQQAKLTGLKDVHNKMGAQLQAEQKRLSDLENTYGTSSTKYKEQAVRVNELSAKYASNRSEIGKLNTAVGGMSPIVAKARDATAVATDKMKAGFEGVKRAAGIASLGIAGFGVAALSGAKKASSLQNEYKVTTNLLETGGEKASEAIKNVAQMQKDGEQYSLKYGKSQQAIAEQYQELVKRGYSSKEALGAMNSELQASVASGDDFNDVVKVSSQVVDAFGMRTDNTAKMTKNTKQTVNELAYAADMTATDFQSLGKGMEYVGDSAHSAGFKLSETSAAMGVLSNHGLEADKAGTGLRKVVNSVTGAIEAQKSAQEGNSASIDKYNSQIAKHQRKIAELQAAVKAGTKTQKSATSAIQTQKDAISDLGEKVQAVKNGGGGASLLDKLGIKSSDLMDSKGNLKDLTTIMGILNSKTKDMGTEQKNAVFNTLFGTTGQQAGIILAQNSSELGKLTDKVQKAGDKGKYVQTLADKNSKTAQMSEKRFKQAWSDLTIMFGSKMLPYMTDAANKMSKMFADKQFTDSIKKVATDIGKVAGGILKVGQYSAEHIDAIKTFAKVVADIWVINKVRKFARATEDFFDLIGTKGISKLEAETTQVGIQTKAYQDLAVAKEEATSAGTGVASVGGKTSSAVSETEGVASEVGSAGKNVSKAGSLEKTGMSIGGKLFTGITAALTVGDVAGTISKAVSTGKANDKYKAASKTAGTTIGAGLGAVLGSVVPGIGTVAGASLGGAIGDQVGGSKTAQSIAKKFSQSINKSMGKVKVKAPKLSMKSSYDKLLKEQKDYYSKKQAQDEKDIKLLYKAGTLTKAEYEKRMVNAKNESKQMSTLSKASGKDRNAISKYYADARQKLETKYNKKIAEDSGKWNRKVQSDIALYGASGKKTREDEKKQELSSEKDKNAKKKALQEQSIKFSTKVTADEARLHNSLAGKIQLASNKQISILTKLQNDKGKVSGKELNTLKKNSQQEYDKSIKYANKLSHDKIKAADDQYEKAVKVANKQQKDTVKAAKDTYTQTIAASYNQYKGNSKWAEEQRKAVKDKAEKQKHDTINAALEQYNKTQQAAEAQNNKVTKAAEKQKTNSINNAKAQRKDTINEINKQEKAVTDKANDQYNKAVASAKAQYKGTSSWAETQRKMAITKAADQRDKVIGHAKKQRDDTITHANNQFKGVVGASEKQRKNSIDKAKNQKDNVSSAAGSQSKAVLGHATKQANGSMEASKKQGEGTTDIFSGIAGWFNKMSKLFGVKETKTSKASFSYTPYSTPAYATGGKVQAGMALVGEEGPEAKYSPYSGKLDIVGAKGAEIVNLASNDYILNARDTAKLFAGQLNKTLPGYASGNIDLGGFLKKIKSGATDIWDNVSDKAMDAVDAIKDPAKTLENLAKKIFNINSVDGMGSVQRGISGGMVDKVIKGVVDAFNKLKKSVDDMGDAANPGGSGVQRWKDTIKKAAAKMHVNLTGSGMNAVLHRIAQESNGNPTIANNWDSNAKAGHPSVGLLQYIQPTLDAWVPKGVKAALKSGWSQLTALFNDSNWLADISVKGGWGPTGHKRMENGGLITTNQMIEVAEKNKPELIVPLSEDKKPRATQLLNSIGAKFTNSDTLNANNNEDIKELKETVLAMKDILQTMLGLNAEQVRAIRETAFDKNKLYQTQAKDQRLANLQNLR